MADIRAVAIRPQSAGGARRHRSDLRSPDRVLSVFSASLADLDRLADDDRRRHLDRLDLFCGGSWRCARDDTGRHRSDHTAQRRLDYVGRRSAGDRGTGLHRTIRAAADGSHDFRRRDLHRRERRDPRHAARGGCADSRSRDPHRQRRLRSETRMDWRLYCASHHRVPGRIGRGLVREQFRREAQRARSRGSLHRPQHRDDAAGVCAESHPADSVSRGNGYRRRGCLQQSGDDSEHPALGLARAPGHAPSDSGNPDVLRLSRHRHRPLSDERHGPSDDAGRARTEYRSAPGKQP